MKRILVVLAVVMALSLALSATSANAQPMGPWYRVQRGDTLSGIALMFGTNVWELAQANGIWNPNLIYAGQVLFIPSGGPGPFPGGYPGMFPGGAYGGFASWSSGGSVGWGGYPQYPFWGGCYPYQMPHFGNDCGRQGNAMPMGGMPFGGGMDGGMSMGGMPFGGGMNGGDRKSVV